jgi:short-subunit dehydrogenase
MKAIVFGSTSDIGQAIINELGSLGYDTIHFITRSRVDFTDPNSDELVIKLLDSIKPNLIINSVGILVDNTVTHHDTMNINFGSSWSIIKYYVNNIDSNVQILLIGSSAYKKGKKDYMLYSASKAALYNLWEGAVDYFKHSNVTINLINPVRVNTKMISERFDPKSAYLDPIDVAQAVSKLLTNKCANVCVDMVYKEVK